MAARMASMFHPISQHTRTAASWASRLFGAAPTSKRVSVPIQDDWVPVHSELRPGVVRVVGVRPRALAA